VGDHEVGVGELEVQRRAGQDDTGQTAEEEGDQKPIAQSMGVAKTSLPPHMVPTQLKNFTPVGTAMSMDMIAKNGSSTCPVAYMWCAQTLTDRAAMAMVAYTRVL